MPTYHPLILLLIDAQKRTKLLWILSLFYLFLETLPVLETSENGEAVEHLLGRMFVERTSYLLLKMRKKHLHILSYI